MRVLLLLLVIYCWRCSIARTTYSKNQWDQSYLQKESFNAEDFLSRTLVAPSSTQSLKTRKRSIDNPRDLESSSKSQNFPLVDLAFGDKIIKISSSLHSDSNEKSQLKDLNKKFHHVIEIIPKDEQKLFGPNRTDCIEEALQESPALDLKNSNIQMLEESKTFPSKLESVDQNQGEMGEANSIIISHLQTNSSHELGVMKHESTEQEDNLHVDSFAGNDGMEGSGGEMSGSNEKSGRFFSIFGRQNETAPPCTTPQNESGHCRPFRHCLLSNALNNYNVFLQYMCLIGGIQVGLCCADNPVIETINPDENEISDSDTQLKLPPEGCGLNIKTRIVGGSVSVPHEWSWMVALMRQNRFYCGGVLINNWYILTAAHCVMGIKVRDITVRLGEYNFNAQTGNEEDMSVAEIKRHAQFVTLTFQHDIALLKLRRSVQYSKFVGSICLPTNRTRDYSDVKGTVVGWGTVSFGGAASPVLREVTIPIWKNKDCDRTYRLETIDDSFLCAGAPEKGEDACQGDSGGPLMTVNERGRWEVVGIVSWGRRCGDPTYPGVYARVTTYLDWINQNMV